MTRRQPPTRQTQRWRVPLACMSLVIFAALAQPRSAAFADAAASGVDTNRVNLEKALNRFDQAVALRDHESPAAQRLYRESLDHFEAVIDNGINNGYLEYNAGNAALRLGHIGEAIAHYRRAEKLIPGDRDLARNLAFARQLCSLHVQSNASNAIANTLTFWHRDTSPRTRWIVMIAAWSVFWGLMLLRLRKHGKSPALFWTSVVAGFVALAACLSVGYDAYGFGERTQGVVVRNDTVLRKGNGEGYQPQLQAPLPDGVEFRIIEIRGSSDGDRWLRIELPDGTDGWIRADRVAII